MCTEKINLKNLTYKMDKREAARQAAAAYPRNRYKAVRQYVILTGIMEHLPEGLKGDLKLKEDLKALDLDPAHDQRFPLSLLISSDASCIERLETKTPDLVEEARYYAAIEKEMLDNLPGYRLPFHSGEAEQLVFFSMVPNIKMTGYNPSPLLSEVEKAGIPEELLEKLKKHFKESADYQGRAAGAEAKLSKIQNTMDRAKTAYEDKEGKRSD